ncbi:DNA polymerase delta small subunit Cdc1 [Coemansia sp. RSA 1822]|nr:DNA polymerase delta small subunit Cdc1 [Coemansia sp. RSA 1853]KAJ2562722.1 DNA polymerase delta small subunit Cdc1 [Coemansia sp. RSA 1822]
MLAMDVDTTIPRTRVHHESQKYESEFKTGRRQYTQQFNTLYYKRLFTLRPFILKHAQAKWETKDIRITPKVLNVEGPEPTFIIGTIFMDSQAKPSTLMQVEKTHWISDPTPPASYRDGTETVYLEDESGRIRLVGAAIDKAVLASGVVAAVMGSETASGDFDVVDICFAGMAAQSERTSSEDVFVALVSGLNASVETPITLEMQVLAEYLCGAVGGAKDQQTSSKIVQTVIAGNIMKVPVPPIGHTEDARANDRVPVQQLVASVDAYLADIAACMPLTLLPGHGDPASASLPQQPLHPSMFAQCRQFTGFQSLTNPAYFEINGTLVLGTSGQNIDDLCRYSDETPCQLAAQSLQWRHIAPTAPDTLWCYPFTEHDPFIVRTTPHVYFAGNQREFDVGVAVGTEGQETRIIMVPEFSVSRSIVLLNLRTLECSTVHIDACV